MIVLGCSRKKDKFLNKNFHSLTTKYNFLFNGNNLYAEGLVDLENDLKEKLIHEAADLWFHVLVLLASRDLKGEDIIKELKKRLGTSGLIEMASRD